MVEKQDFLWHYYGGCVTELRMIIEMTTSAFLSLSGLSPRGSSDVAQFVAAKAEEGRRQLYSLSSFGLDVNKVRSELASVADECSAPNWDGYQAKPVSKDAFRRAYFFVEALPLDTPIPSVGAEPDGHLTLEWYRAPRRVLSVSPED
jgi:hypothetical protein